MKWLSLRTRRDLKGYLFILPWLFGLVFFFLIPIVQNFSFSFFRIDAQMNKTFIGWDNYVSAFMKDAEFPVYLTSSLKTLVTDVPLISIFSFLIAAVLHQRFKSSGFFKVIFFMTVILSSGVFLQLQDRVAGLNSQQLAGTLQDNVTVSGMLNNIRIEKYLMEIGIPSGFVEMLIGPMQQVFSIINRSGIQIFIFLAGLNGISPALYEASYIEGATAWENFWKVTFPLVTPLILVNIIYTIIDSFTSFSNQTMAYVYKRSFISLDKGFASAISWIYFAMIVVILITVGILISKKVFYYDK